MNRLYLQDNLPPASDKSRVSYASLGPKSDWDLVMGRDIGIDQVSQYL